jgi:gamma-glutamylaminecyclotransferase
MPESSDPTRGEIALFVYGTLLRGQSNHRFLGDARCLGAARTEPEFELVDLGSFPAMVRGGRTAVVGEVYALDTETLRAVDELEEHPKFFCRSPVRLEDGRDVESYLLPASQAACFPRIASGDWRGWRA